MEAVEDEEVEVNTLDPPSRPSSPETLSSDSDSEFEDEAWDPISEDLVVETHEEVEVLFARLETDFTQMLRNAQLRLQEAERLKRRPSTYAKVNATHRNTIASRKRKALRQETEMRAKGYLDIRTFGSVFASKHQFGAWGRSGRKHGVRVRVRRRGPNW